MRLLMTQLALLSRAYMVSVFSGYGNSEAIAKRIYEIPLKFKAKAELVFGLSLGEELVELLSLHTVHLQSLVNALLFGDQAAVNYSIEKLFQNGDDIAEYYAKINPFWDADKWKTLLRNYNRTLVEEAFALKAGEFENELEIFDRLLFIALQMGDYLADGLIQYLTVSHGGI
jgi:hypothetical protein